jgi:hypothetical protein
MTKPTERTDWATAGDGSGGASAIRSATDSSRWNLGWQTTPGNLPGEQGEKPNLNEQNYWQYAVHQWISYFNNGQAYFVAADDSSTEDKAIADVVCDGTNDNETIDDAITAALLNAHKKVILLSGSYTFNAAVTLDTADLIVEGRGEVRIYADAHGFANGLFLLQADRVKLRNIIFAGDGSFKAEDGMRLSGASNMEATGLLFETNSIIKQSASGDSNTAILVNAGTTNCLVEATFETESVQSLDATGIASLIDYASTNPTGNTFNFQVADRALKGQGTNVYQDNVTPIRYRGAKVTGNNVNTNWINIEPDIANPSGTLPSSYSIDQYRYRYIGGDIQLDYVISWNGGTLTSTVDVPFYPTLMSDIPSQNFVASNTKSIGVMAHRDISVSGKFNQFDVFSWYIESGVGFRLTDGGSTPKTYSSIGSNSAISFANIGHITM